MSTASKRHGFAFLLLSQIIMLSLLGPVTGFAQGVTGEDSTDTAAPAAGLGIAHGAHLRPVYINYGNGTWYSYGDEVMAMNALVGKDLAIVMYFTAWSKFDPFLMDEIQKRVPAARRPVVMLTWEPSSNSTGCNLGYGDGQGPLRAINSGRCDDFIRSYARALKARPERIILRLAHEMNITSTQWWPGHYSLDASAYVQMYRRVRGLFREVGVPNVEWMWSPNNASNPADQWNDLHKYYPGDDAVDWIGLSGFNWYNWRSRPWETSEQLYREVLTQLACDYPKPVILSEVGTVDGPSDGSKAAWITYLYDELDDFPFVRGIVWFNDFAYGARGNADFRVTTGGQDCKVSGGCSGVQALPGAAGQLTTGAFISAVRSSVYTNKLPSLAQATPPNRLCSTPNQTFSLSRSDLALSPGGAGQLTVYGFNYPSQVQISFELPAGVRATASPTIMAPPSGTATVKLIADAKLPPGVYKGTIRVGTTSLPLTVRILQVRAYLPNARN